MFVFDSALSIVKRLHIKQPMLLSIKFYQTSRLDFAKIPVNLI